MYRPRLFDLLIFFQTYDILHRIILHSSFQFFLHLSALSNNINYARDYNPIGGGKFERECTPPHRFLQCKGPGGKDTGTIVLRGGAETLIAPLHCILEFFPGTCNSRMVPPPCGRSSGTWYTQTGWCSCSTGQRVRIASAWPLAKVG